MEEEDATNESKVLGHSYLKQTIGYDKNSLNSYCKICDLRLRKRHKLTEHKEAQLLGSGISVISVSISQNGLQILKFTNSNMRT